jgi:predicted porin
MKKTLVALAALAATSAFAQSSVTIYGQFDAGVYRISDIGTAKKSATVYGDGATFSNILGFKGTEDMGGGLKAGFDFQTDVQTNNGGLNNAGLFRRQANGSIEGGFGQVKLGLTTNPIIATNGLLMPVSGNSVSTSTSSALGYADFYTKNAVTYTAPAFMGLVAQVQKGMSNNLDSGSDGSVTAWSLNYTNGPLAIRAAGQNRKDNGVSSSSNASSSTLATLANTAGFDKKGSIMGVSYKIGPVTVAAASLKTNNATVLNGATTERKGSQFGVGYTTGAWTLGGSLTKAEDSKMTNLQARYALSKRTNLIGQYGIADNSSRGLVNFAPLAFNTGAQPAQIVTGYAGTAGVKSTGMGVALTHSF